MKRIAILLFLGLSISSLAQETKYFRQLRYNHVSPFIEIVGTHPIDSTTASQTSHYIFRYDAEGKTSEIINNHYHTEKVHPLASIGAYKVVFLYEDGKETRTFYDANNVRITNDRDVFKEVYLIDKNDGKTQLNFYDLDDKPMQSNWKITEYQWQQTSKYILEKRYNLRGKLVDVSPYFPFGITGIVLDKNGIPKGHYNLNEQLEITENRHGTASYQDTYDEVRNHVKYTYHDKEDNLVMNQWNYAVGEKLYDKLGNNIMLKLFDTNNKILDTENIYSNASIESISSASIEDSQEIKRQYAGEYVFEAAGITVKIYTKENGASLYVSIPGQPERELIATGQHKFSIKTLEGFSTEFKNAENGVFNELMLIQPNGTFKTVRKEKVKIDDLPTIDKNLIENDFSGVVLVAKNDSIIFNKAYGRKNNQENGLNDLNTVFDICSITKQFTSAGILKLSMQNKVSLDDNLSKYFDAVPKDKKNITIHQLLTHSSGLTAGIGDDYDTITEEEFLSQVFSSKLISPVGKRFNYSNMGYSLLALIIEKVSGMGYETFLNEAIFKPSKMNHTGYVIPDWKNNEVANGFFNGTEAKKPNEENWSEKGPYLNLKGNGGILTRASDLLLWSQAIRDNTVLDKATTSKYLYPHFQVNGIYTHYGYGWGIENNNSENKLVIHGGNSDLFTTDMLIYPEKRITIIVLSNTPAQYVSSIARKISNSLLAK